MMHMLASLHPILVSLCMSSSINHRYMNVCISWIDYFILFFTFLFAFGLPALELNIVWLKYAKQLICGCCTAWSSVANSLQRSGWQYLKMVDLFIWHILKKHSIRQKFWKPLADAVCVYIRLRLVDFSAFCLLICVFGLYYVQHSFFFFFF